MKSPSADEYSNGARGDQKNADAQNFDANSEAAHKPDTVAPEPVASDINSSESRLKYNVPAQYVEHSDADSEPYYVGSEASSDNEDERQKLEERIIAEARDVLSQQVIGQKPLVPPRAPWHQRTLSSLVRNHGVLLALCTLLLWGVWSGQWPLSDRDLRIGAAAPRDIVAPRATSLLDREATHARREEAAALVTPEYDSELEAQARATALLDLALRFSREEANLAKGENATVGKATRKKATRDNAAFAVLPEAASSNSATTRQGSISGRTSTRAGSQKAAEPENRAARRLKTRLAQRGVTLSLDAALQAIDIAPTRWVAIEKASRQILRAAYFDEGRVQQIRSDVEDDLVLAAARMKRRADRLAAVATSPELSVARGATSTRSPLRSASLTGNDAKVALSLAQSVARVPNLVVNPARTRKAREEARQDVAPVYRNIMPGTVLVEAGTVIDAEKWSQLQDLDIVAPRFDPVTAVARLIFCALVVSFGAAFVARFSPLAGASTSSLWLLAVFPVLALALCRAALRVPFGESMVLPIVACAAMTLTILLDVRAGALCALGVSILLGALVQRGGDAMMLTSVALGSMIAVLAVGEITSRIHLVRAGVVIALTHAALFAALNILRDSSFDFEAGALLAAAFAVGATVVAAGLAMFLERPFGITTHLSLLELSSPDEAIMRRMQSEAPGTYTHSLMVAQLAEAAAKAVGADSLLCRVGGLYHDIGKLRRPHCFIENQHGINVHDRLSPQLSSLLIVSHVKDGLTLARALRPPLPGPVQEIIAQHHGRSLVSYFYHRALKEAQDMSSTRTISQSVLAVDESLFRYPGPRPQSKEAAIVMLADSVEASSRSLPDLTPEKLDEHIRHMVESRLREGELDDCALTLRDLSTVEKAFAHVLRGALHQRIEYPDPTRDFNFEGRAGRRDDDWAKNATRDPKANRSDEKRSEKRRHEKERPEKRGSEPRRSAKKSASTSPKKAEQNQTNGLSSATRSNSNSNEPASGAKLSHATSVEIINSAANGRSTSIGDNSDENRADEAHELSAREIRRATADALSSHVKRNRAQKLIARGSHTPLNEGSDNGALAKNGAVTSVVQSNDEK